jgi:hypothetical protein
MSEQKPAQKPAKVKTAIKPLNPKTKGLYDDLINKVRVQMQIPFNRTILANIAQTEYVKLRTVNGQADLKRIAAPYATVKVSKDVERLEKVLAEKKAALVAMGK